MDIQGYWCIFNHIHRHPTRREGEVSPALIWKSRKCPGFGKKGPDCVNLWVTFSIQNANLRVFGWKNSKMFPCLQGLFSFSFFWQSVYWSVLVPQNLPSAEKILIAHLPSGTILFARHSILSVWQCSECDLMLCTTSECTTSDIFRILAYSELCLFRYMQNYSIILNIIKAYSCILKHFWGIYMHIQHPV